MVYGQSSSLDEESDISGPEYWLSVSFNKTTEE
jgi:hypothetical protein